jgi:hypothetical protein
MKSGLLKLDKFGDEMGIYRLLQNVLCHFDEKLQISDEKLHKAFL